MQECVASCPGVPHASAGPGGAGHRQVPSIAEGEAATFPASRGSRFCTSWPVPEPRSPRHVRPEVAERLLADATLVAKPNGASVICASVAPMSRRGSL
jgi:hypothetical protein